jgi:hypothetical protein
MEQHPASWHQRLRAAAMTSDPRIRDPLLDTAEAEDLQPTQITVGYREVEAKRRSSRVCADKPIINIGGSSAPMASPSRRY